MRRLLATFAVLAVLGAVTYAIWANARWREQVARAEAAEFGYREQMQSLASRQRVSDEHAAIARHEARVASARSAQLAGRLARVRDSLAQVTSATDSLPVLVAVVAVQDSVIVAQGDRIRADSSRIVALEATGRLLGMQRDVAMARGDSLLALVNRAPVVQLAAPRPRTGWLVAGALVAGMIVGVW